MTIFDFSIANKDLKFVIRNLDYAGANMDFTDDSGDMDITGWGVTIYHMKGWDENQTIIKTYTNADLTLSGKTLGIGGMMEDLKPNAVKYGQTRLIIVVNDGTITEPFLNIKIDGSKY